MPPAVLWDGRKIVDLSLLLAENLPCTWPGHMPYQQKTFNYFVDQESPEGSLHSHCGTYQTRWLVVDEHLGTHFDAPAHFIPRPGSGVAGAQPVGEVTADKVGLEQLIGPAAVIDVSALVGRSAAPGESPEIGLDLVTAYEDEHGPLAPGDIVLFRSGWDEHHYRPGAAGSAYAAEALIHKRGAGWPAPSVAVIEHLLARGVRCVGTDGPSMGSSHDGEGVHQVGLGAGMVFIEALAHLSQLPARGALFFFAPLNVAHGTGAPGRAFAVID